MRRRKFLKVSLFAAAVLSGIQLGNFTAAVAAGKNTEEYKNSFHQDVHYEYLRNSFPSTANTVTLFFWYGSPNSYNVNNDLKKWIKTQAPNLTLRHVPATLNSQWIDGARAYYSLSVLGQIKELHQPLFDAYASGVVTDRITLENFLEEKGIDLDLFWEHFFSAESTKATQKFSTISQIAGLEYVPTVVVGGRYKILTNRAKDWKEVYEVINHLVDNQPPKAIPKKQ